MKSFTDLLRKGMRATRSPAEDTETPPGCFILLLLAESRQQGKTTGGQTEGATSFQAVPLPATSLLITIQLLCCCTNLCRALHSIAPFPGSTSRKALTAGAGWRQTGRVTSDTASSASPAFCSLQLAPGAAPRHPIRGLDTK